MFLTAAFAPAAEAVGVMLFDRRGTPADAFGVETGDEIGEEEASDLGENTAASIGDNTGGVGGSSISRISGFLPWKGEADITPSRRRSEMHKQSDLAFTTASRRF